MPTRVSGVAPPGLAARGLPAAASRPITSSMAPWKQTAPASSPSITARYKQSAAPKPSVDKRRRAVAKTSELSVPGCTPDGVQA